MEKHTKEKLKQLAKGVFADDKNAACYYADENGTFLNEGQYASRSDEDKDAFVRIDNPALGQKKAPVLAKAEEEAAKKKLEEEAEAAALQYRIDHANKVKAEEEAAALKKAEEAELAEKELAAKEVVEELSAEDTSFVAEITPEGPAAIEAPIEVAQPAQVDKTSKAKKSKSKKAKQ